MLHKWPTSLASKSTSQLMSSSVEHLTRHEEDHGFKVGHLHDRLSLARERKG